MLQAEILTVRIGNRGCLGPILLEQGFILLSCALQLRCRYDSQVIGKRINLRRCPEVRGTGARCQHKEGYPKDPESVHSIITSSMNHQLFVVRGAKTGSQFTGRKPHLEGRNGLCATIALV